MQQDGPLSVQVSWLAALTQVGLRNVLPVNAHAVYVLPGTEGERQETLITTSEERRTSPRPSMAAENRRSPALVTADHVAVVVGEATNAPGDISAVAPILRSAECGAAGSFILAPWNKQTPLSLSDQHGGRRGGWWRRWGPCAIVMVLIKGYVFIMTSTNY